LNGRRSGLQFANFLSKPILTGYLIGVAATMDLQGL